MRYSFFVLMFGFVFGFGGVALAQEMPLASQEKIDQTPTATTETPINLTKFKKISQLKNKAEIELSKRINKLGSLEDMLKNKKYQGISSEGRNFLQDDISKNYSAMKDLREKARASKDVQEVRSILTSMFEDYRIFGIVYPRDRGLLAVEKNISLVIMYEGYIVKLDERVAKLEKEGIDVKEIKEIITSIKNYLEEAKGVHYKEAKTIYNELTAAHYPAKEKIESARTHNKEGIKQYDLARGKYKQALAHLKKLEKTTKTTKKNSLKPSPTPKVSVAPVVSTTPTPEAKKEIVITYTDGVFSPATITIKSGEKVTFKNTNTANKMWVASDPHPTHTIYPEFDQDTSGDEYSFTFTKKGSWGYHNHVRANARGTITVE